MSGYVANTLFFSTMLIENEWGGNGTGFLVSKIISQEEGGRVFLVTNKHVLNKFSSFRNAATHIIIHYNEITPDEKIIKKDMLWPIIQGGRPIWREHPDSDVDVLVFDITGFISFVRNIHVRYADYSLLATADILNENEIKIGEEVVIIGYPLGFTRLATRHKDSNLPLFRSGIIASSIGDMLQDVVNENGEDRTRNLRGFLIDGGVINGSSGSPIVLKPNLSRFQNGAFSMGTSLPPYILGILAETRYAPIGNMDNYANLGLAFDATTIRETIDLFSNNTDSAWV